MSPQPQKAMKIQPLKEIPIDYSFSDKEQVQLYDLLETVKSNPFQDFNAFLSEMKELKQDPALPVSFTEWIKESKKRDLAKKPFLRISNCPTDQSLPVLDWNQPLEEKYQKKKSFIGEAFLVLYAELAGTPTLSYKNTMNGDYIRDIHPEKALRDSQSARTTRSFGFHKEIPIRPTSPDYLNILGLRNDPANEIHTTLIRNTDIVTQLPAAVVEALKKPLFTTPHTVLAVQFDTQHKLTEAQTHAIIGTHNEFFYHETRTTSTDKAGQKAIEQLDTLLREQASKVFLGPGDFISLANKHALHGRSVGEIKHPEAVKHRWLIKTFNAGNIADYEPYFYQNQYAVIDG